MIDFVVKKKDYKCKLIIKKKIGPISPRKERDHACHKREKWKMGQSCRELGHFGWMDMADEFRALVAS